MAQSSQLPAGRPPAHAAGPQRRRRIWRPTLGRKLAVVTVFFLLFWSGYLGISHLSRAHTAAFAEQVNESGRLRMQSQRIAFLAAVCDDELPAGRGRQCREALQHAVADYEAILAGIEAVPLEFFLNADQQRIGAAIDTLRLEWGHYRRAAEAIAAGAGDSAVARGFIERNAELMLERAEALTSLLVASQRRAQAWRDNAQNALQLLGLLMLVGIAALGYRQVVRPLRALVRLTRRAGKGDYSGRLDYLARDEIGELVAAFNETNARTERLVDALEAEAAAARRAEARADNLLESAADGIIICDFSGRIVRVNREAERIFAYAREELIDRNVLDLVPERLREVHRRYQSIYALRPGRRAMRMDATPVLGLRKDGSEVPLEISLSPVSDDGEARVIAVVRDASQRVRAEADRRRLLTILNATPDVVAIFKVDGTLVYLNPAGRQLLGVGLDDPLTGRQLEELLLPSCRRRLHAEVLPQALSTGMWSGELVLQDRSGRELPVSQLLIAHTGAGSEPRYLSTIARDISERKRHEGELIHRATHDQLTGLANRALFEDRLERAIRHAQRHQRMVAVLFIDLDNFKLVNDSMGHAVGDQLLCEIGRRLQLHLRREDTKARLGGDEFAVILEGLVRCEDVEQIVRNLAEALQRPIDLQGREFVVTASIGISLYPDDGATVDMLLVRADVAMYQAKAAGRDNYRFYSPDMNTHSAERLDLESDLRHALDRGELQLHYQPVVDRQGAIIGCEALLRWQHPQHGVLPPVRFIPVAEESGLIVPIGEWVLRQACRQARAWQMAGLPLRYVAVNVSAKQLRDRALVKAVQSALAESGLSPDALELELTEGSILHGVTDASSILHEIRALGVRLVADDFGTGYSSLSYLKLFRFDKVKIDREFVRDVLTDPGDAAIAEAIAAMARAFHAAVVAEGVETQEQAVLLKGYGCNQLQGFLYGRPLPADAFQALLQEQASPSPSSA